MNVSEMAFSNDAAAYRILAYGQLPSVLLLRLTRHPVEEDLIFFFFRIPDVLCALTQIDGEVPVNESQPITIRV